jgi:hypothetical protein
LLEEMLTLLGRVAEERPVVVVVEDLHWADASSRELFAYLARNLTGVAVLLVGTIRTGEPAAGHPNRRMLAELGRGGTVDRIDLGPLEQRHVAALLAAVDERPPDPARSVRIHRRSGGNPLFVEALSTAGEAPPGDLRTLLLARITDLPDPAREALEAMAVAGAELADDLVRAVAGGPGGRLQDPLDDLTGRELVVARESGYAIRHELIREAVYDALPPTRRRSMHARYAAALAEGGTEGGMALAEHWTAAGEFERALPAAWHAADRAGHQNAYDEQLHLLELVLEQWAKVPEPSTLIGAGRTVVLERAATVAFAAGRSAAGVAYGTAALDELDPAAEPERAARLLGLRGRLQSRLDGGDATTWSGGSRWCRPGRRTRCAAACCPPWRSPSTWRSISTTAGGTPQRPWTSPSGSATTPCARPRCWCWARSTARSATWSGRAAPSPRPAVPPTWRATRTRS